jgi:AraC-like DNA-binding protein
MRNIKNWLCDGYVIGRPQSKLGAMKPRRAIDHELRAGNGAQLFSFGARSIFVGPALQLSPHRNAVAVLAVGVDASFRLSVNAHRDADARQYRTCRSALIAPNAFHHLEAPGIMGFVHVDALSNDYARLRAMAGEVGDSAVFDLSAERTLIAWLQQLHKQGRESWPEVRAKLEALLRDNDTRPDPRVVAALQVLHADPAMRHSLDSLARHAKLSTSRFIHLFKQTTGVPLRRYKLWVAMSAATRSMLRGKNLTTAAVDAGFASSAHFSSAYREMFGMEPSRLLSSRLRNNGKHAR